MPLCVDLGGRRIIKKKNSETNVSNVIIDESVIRGESSPLLVYANNEAPTMLQAKELPTKDKQAGG